MSEAGIGWIAAIIIGGLAGWLAEMFMKSGTGILMNIVLGIVGAALANWLLGIFGIALGGWIGYLIAGFIGTFPPWQSTQNDGAWHVAHVFTSWFAWNL